LVNPKGKSLKIELVNLPEAQKQFIKRNLFPGGEIVYFEGKVQWFQYLIGDHNYFQVGGWSGLDDSELIESSPRVRAFKKIYNLLGKEWRLPGKELIRGYESEWGSSPGL